MRIINKKITTKFQSTYPDSKASLNSLLAEMEDAQWDNPNELFARYHKNADYINGKVVFDIAGSKYRLQTTVNYRRKIVMLDRIGTHKEYDKWKI